MESQAMQTPIETRSFHYSDGKSDKFWMIMLEDRQHTVRYGRAGTQGQQQTKEFPTAEKARQSCEKLIREKIAKGYVEETNFQLLAATPIEEPAIASPQPQQFASELQNSIDLDPKDWFWASWRNLTPLERPQPKPFDLKTCLARLQKVTVNSYHHWNWSKAAIAPVLSREEAHFWFSAIAPKRIEPGVSKWLVLEELVEKLSHQTFDGNISLEQVKESSWYVSDWAENQDAEIFPVMNLLSVDDFIELTYWGANPFLMLSAFRDHVLPYLTQPEIERLRSQFRSRLDPRRTPQNVYEPAFDFHFAAALGLHDALLPLIESWSDNVANDPNQYYFAEYRRVQEIIFGLNDPHLVEHHLRRLGLKLKPPYGMRQPSAYVRAWLAHTELSALDLIRDTVLAAHRKEEAEELLETFALVKAPEAAPFMLELMLSSKAPQIARRWLNEHPESAIVGLIPTATGRGKLADAAIEFLRTMKRKGHTSDIQACIENTSAEIAARIQSAVLNAEKEYIPFDSHTTPQGLQQAFFTSASTKKTGWTIAAAELPPIAIGDYCLNSAQIEAIVTALRQSKLGSPHPLIAAVQTQIDRAATDAFAWKLFELWLAEGAPSKENWAMQAVGLLGSDVSALKLAPLIREWPGESQHHRAVTGLECLRSISTDTALMQINGIAQRVKFKGIKQRAQDCMEAIAQDRQMTREQLEDRIVPDCELDERGSRLFEFGARQFRFVLGADLKPMVKDADGKVKPNLPNPLAKDDPEKAQAAIADWKLFKKQVGEVIKIQPVRLEQAMVTGRRWQLNEFELLLVQHPLMTHLTQRLIWGGYDASGQLIATFRVTEDQTCADSNDEIFDLTEIDQVGIVHPLHLTPEVRSTWGELLSDYEIVQPFLQLGRSLHDLEPGESTQKEITRFKAAKVPAIALIGTLEKLGWARGTPQDAGVFCEHSKPFYGADVTAVVQYDGVPIGYMEGWEDQAIERCFFLKGSSTRMYPDHTKAIALGEIDPVVISEVLKDLIAIASKAQ